MRRYPHFGNAPSSCHKLCEAHGWRLDHDTENCYALRDLRNILYPQAGQATRGRGEFKGGLNATDANAVVTWQIAGISGKSRYYVIYWSEQNPYRVICIKEKKAKN
jgi:hypothetical protein